MGLTVTPALSGGASAPQLPVWTFVPGANPTIGPGQFCFDSTNFASTVHIRFSNTAKNGPGIDMSVLLARLGYYVMMLIDPSGKGYLMNVYSVSGGTVDYTELFFNWDSSPASLSGDYGLYICAALEIVNQVNGNQGAVTVNDDTVVAASSLTPIADGSYTIGTNIVTFEKGRCISIA